MTNDNDLQPDRSDIERVQRLVGTHYRLNWIIGRGGMSTVWLATDNDTGDPVAIKVLKPEYTDNTEFRERFRNEANASSLIDSPNVVHTHAYREVLDAGLTFCFIIMEYVRGESLADVPKSSHSTCCSKARSGCRPFTLPAWFTAISSPATC